jgi:hypothetical protein
VLQRDAQLPGVKLDQPAGTFEALVAGVAADRDAMPAVCAGRLDRQAGGHLVADHQRALCQPLEFRRGVDAVLGVVELLRPDHPEPVFEVAERITRAEYVDPRRQLHRPRQPLVEVHPRLVPLGDLQRLHPADGEDGDVPLFAGHPVDQLDRGAVRRAVALDLLGEPEQVAALPRSVGHRRERVRRGHAQRDRPVEQPLELVRCDPPTAHAERAEHLVELLHGAAQLAPFAFGDAAAEGAQHPLRQAVAE